MKKLTLATTIAALSATLLASNAHAMDCADMSGNQLLAAIERGQCEIEKDTAQNTVRIVNKDEYIRTSRNSGNNQGASAKSGGGYKY